MTLPRSWHRTPWTAPPPPFAPPTARVGDVVPITQTVRVDGDGISAWTRDQWSEFMVLRRYGEY